jgi:hypothetical protein
MKPALIILGTLVIVVALLALIGAMLPRDHVATRSARFKASPEQLFATVRDFGALATWRPDVKSVELLPPSGGAVQFREVSKHGAVTYRLKEERAGERLVLEIADETLPFGGTWTFEIARAPSGGGSVRITEHGFVKPALFRVLARFVFGYTSTMDAYLRALGRKFGEDVTPS